jgi:hypothetical protein
MPTGHPRVHGSADQLVSKYSLAFRAWDPNQPAYWFSTAERRAAGDIAL